MNVFALHLGRRFDNRMRKGVLGAAVEGLCDLQPRRGLQDYFTGKDGKDAGMGLVGLRAAYKGGAAYVEAKTGRRFEASELQRRRDWTLDDYFGVFADRVGINGVQGSRAIIAIWGKYDHWTVVRSATRHVLTLTDSSGPPPLSRLLRNRCTVAGVLTDAGWVGRGKRHHLVDPVSTLLVTEH